MENASENYEIKNDDSEIHAINVIIEVLERHVSTRKQNPNSQKNIDEGDLAINRVLNYVCDRYKTKK